MLYDIFVKSTDLIEIARELRKNSTPAESFLWIFLRDNRLNGFKFRRQYPLCGYILDFYCMKTRLAIELDGAPHRHPEQKELDQERTRELEDAGVLILRFWNHEVFDNIEWVLDRISTECQERLSKKQPIGTP